jgi:maltooligosyltrehalose trehalohydrolase
MTCRVAATWGYDGVLLNAPNAQYGQPADLKRLIRAAHELNLVVYLDVVYNHFGPQLNFLHAYAEPFFTDHHKTGWGPPLISKAIRVNLSASS